MLDVSPIENTLHKLYIGLYPPKRKRDSFVIQTSSFKETGLCDLMEHKFYLFHFFRQNVFLAFSFRVYLLKYISFLQYHDIDNLTMKLYPV
jgi:hypothetical protein